MKFVLKSMLFVFFFIFSLLIFLPKEQFYYLVENQLSKKNLIISDEIIDEKLFGLNIKDANLYYDGINFSLVDDIYLDTYLLYNKMEVKDIRVSESFNNFLPSKIDYLKIKYSIKDLLNIDISSSGEFGVFNGKISILDKKIIGELIPSPIMQTKYKNLLKRFKIVNGKYTYELRLK